MKRLAFAFIPVLFMLALIVGACGKPTGGVNSTPPGTIGMDATNFVVHAVTVKVGDTVHFVDPAGSGGTHVICLGKDQSCNASATGPTALKGPGFTINAGDPSKDIVFDTAGTYDITCTVHPNMNVTVTVQ
ncbi:MAG TPA: plastocyanin/azurin family copper-binding protein [Ktedonobacterales bacterium]|nr:plastocyanin/azurin family copper-binding protein [Ktedonobacterales bacterium]